MKLNCLFYVSIFLFSGLTYSYDLVFQKDGKEISKFSLKTMNSGELKISDSFIGSVDETIYNPWRKYRRTYRGYDFSEILNSVYGNDWRSAKRISFVAVDGYRQIAVVAKMLKEMKKYRGLLAFRETGKKGFTKVNRKGKTVDPAPYYLVWGGFTKKDKVSHGDTLKWPYQLKSIEILSQ